MHATTLQRSRATRWFAGAAGFVGIAALAAAASAGPFCGNKGDKSDTENPQTRATPQDEVYLSAGPGPKGEGGEAQTRGEGRRGEGRGRRVARALFRGIELDDAQRSQVREILMSAHEQTEAWRDENREQLDAMRSEMRAAREAGDKEKMQALADEWRELREDAPKPVDVADEIRGVLTAGQVEQFDENVADLKERIAQRMAEHRERGGERGERRNAGGDGEKQRGSKKGDQLDL